MKLEPFWTFFSSFLYRLQCKEKYECSVESKWVREKKTHSHVTDDFHQTTVYFNFKQHISSWIKSSWKEILKWVLMTAVLRTDVWQCSSFPSSSLSRTIMWLHKKNAQHNKTQALLRLKSASKLDLIKVQLTARHEKISSKISFNI